MLYRKLGSTGIDVSILGFGCMRIPVVNGNQSQMDEEKARAMVCLQIIDIK